MSDGFDRGVEDRVSAVWQGVFDAEHRAEAAREAGERIAGIRESLESADGVWVEVDSVGRLTGLRFSGRALGLSAEDLAGAVLKAVFEARRLAGERALEVAAAGFGVDDSMLDRLRSVYVPEPLSAPEPPEPEPKRIRLGPYLFG